MEENWIWKPVAFDERWLALNTEQIDQVTPVWFEKRASIKESNEELKAFFTRIKRRQAIETGIVEGLYSLSRGATETFVMQGFAEDYLQHGDSNLPNDELLAHLNDQYEALDWVFDFIKSDRDLSVGFIKELHALLTCHQATAVGITPDGQRIQIPLLHGEFKVRPNNPMQSDGAIACYCPPMQVDSEMDAFISVYSNEMKQAHPVVRATWAHYTFVTIHPFQDGNGRMARLVASLILIQGGLLPFALERTQRPQYFAALEKADAGIYQPLLDMLIADQLESMGPEVVARALAGKIQTSAQLQKFVALEEKRKAINAYSNDIAVQKAEAVNLQLQAVGTARSFKGVEEPSIYINLITQRKFQIRFTSGIERDTIVLQYEMREAFHSISTDAITITADMDEESAKLLVEAFIQKKLTCALQFISQSL
ncbi:MAG: Fic family protein [Oscillospiraceae bacterium]|jgi:fido (protein-threonine AMPylation protein)|nr:Fic family protein [Oscillospiraceae bacterium]